MEAEGDGTAQQGLCGRWAWQITGYLRLLILSTDQFGNGALANVDERQDLRAGIARSASAWYSSGVQQRG